MDPSQDPIVRQLREQVSDVDRGLVEAINARLRLVAQLKSYKDSRGYAFVDPEREEWMFRDVSAREPRPALAGGPRGDLPGDPGPLQAGGLLTRETRGRTLSAMTPAFRTWAWSWRHERCGSIA